MEWETVKISINVRRQTQAFATVGYGRIVLSFGACSLLKEFPKYRYVQLMRGVQYGKKVLGIRLLENDGEDCLRLAKRKENNEVIAFSGYIDNKPVVREIFGEEIGMQNKATRYPVTVDDIERNILVLHLED